ncbi:hypothetical protein ACHAW6_010451 [Cyclotella cf. meneghiniana]
MRACCFFIPIMVIPFHSLAVVERDLPQVKHRLRVRDRYMHRQLETDVYRLKADAYRIMEAPKLISLQKKERIGSRMIDKYVEVSSRSENGVAVSVNVDVNVVVSTKNSREPECTEWQTIYISASSKSSKSEAKSGKGSKSMKGGKSGKDSSKSAKLIPVRKCIATRAPPTEKPSQETALLVTPNPLEPTPNAEPRPTPIPTMINITPDPTEDTQLTSGTANPTTLLETESPVTPGPTLDQGTSPGSSLLVLASSLPSPSGDVTIPPVIALPPQGNVIPTVPPQVTTPLGLPTLPPLSGTIPSLPPALASFPVLPVPTQFPVSTSLPVLSTLPPQSGAMPTEPPSLRSPPVLPTLRPQSGAIPTLPPVSSPPVLPSLPTQIGAILTLPPASSPPPVLPTLPPQMRALPTLPPGVTLPPALLTLPSQGGALPTLPPGIPSTTASSLPPISGSIPTLLPGISSAPVVSSSPPMSASLVPSTTTTLSPTIPSNNTASGSSSPSANDLTRLSWDFENGVFPVPPWATGGDGVWAIDQSQVDKGLYSIKSPDFEAENLSLPLVSNATLTLADDFSGGVMKISVFASVQPPRDIFTIFIDDESAAQVIDTQEFRVVELGVAPGPHTVNFSYQYNIFGVDPLPESPPDRLGAVWIDHVTIESLPPAERANEEPVTLAPLPSTEAS